MRVTLGALVDDDVEEAGILMGEAVVVLPPDGGCDQQVERRDDSPPRQVVADRQPLRVLVEHRVDHVDERLVRRQEPVTTREQVALEHALHRMFGEHLDDASVGGHLAAIIVLGKALLEPQLLRHVVERRELVRRVLVGAEHTEGVHVRAHHVAQKLAHHVSARRPRHAGTRELHRVVAKIGQPQRLPEHAAVRVRIRPMRRCPAGASARSAGTGVPSAVKSSSGL